MNHNTRNVDLSRIDEANELKNKVEVYLHEKYKEDFQVLGLEFSNFNHKYDVVTARSKIGGIDVIVRNEVTNDEESLSDNYFGHFLKTTIERRIESELKIQGIPSLVFVARKNEPYSSIYAKVEQVSDYLRDHGNEGYTLCLFHCQNLDNSEIERKVVDLCEVIGVRPCLYLYEVSDSKYDELESTRDMGVINFKKDVLKRSSFIDTYLEKNNGPGESYE
jgi:hypothetical protein